MSQSSPNDYDSPWKDIIERYFPDCLSFFFTAAFDQIDWSRGYQFLDKELQKILRRAQVGKRLADKLVKVYLKSGKPAFVYIHIEVQGQYDSEFPERMFVYHYRIFDHYHQRVISLAILTDDHPHWRPQQYGYEDVGCELKFKFPIVKILDYRGKEQELRRSGNPFALVVLAHLKTLETRHCAQHRLHWKRELFTLLQTAHYSPQEIVDLFWFLDWIMALPNALPNALQTRFDKFVSVYEEEHNMRFVTSIERTALAKGRQEGVQKGSLQTFRNNVLEVLRARFKRVSRVLRNRIEAVSDTALLSKLLKEAALVGSVQAFERLLDQPEGRRSVPAKPQLRLLKTAR